jgi:hypothetical protein
MIGQNLLYESDPESWRDVGQPNQAAMPLLLEENQPAEVLVHGHENPLVGSRASEDFPVSGIVPPLARLDHVMSFRAQPIREGAPGAPVDEESHLQETLTASSESCAMTASA